MRTITTIVQAPFPALLQATRWSALQRPRAHPLMSYQKFQGSVVAMLQATTEAGAWHKRCMGQSAPVLRSLQR